MRILILMMLLPFVPGEVINLKDITVTDGSLSCKCNFKLVFNTVGDLKKSKITCEKKKSMIISEHQIPTDTGSVISISFTVMKNGKTKLTKATLQPPPPTTVPCTPGYTQVCSAAAAQDHMTKVCPATADRQTTTAGSGECSCLPTRGVEQDLASGVSPLGSSHQGCVRVPTERMFRSSQPLGVNMTEMADKWKISQFVSSLTGISKREMKQALMDSMTQEMEHQVALKREGPRSRFIRSTEQSDAIAHNYMIMRSLQIAAENVSGSVRLTAYPRGRVEIYKDGQWGTLCGHYWWNNQQGAINLCRQLGYTGGVKYTADGGVGPIVAGNRLCKGGESTIFDCPLVPGRYETQGCSHSIDQGVSCQTSQVSDSLNRQTGSLNQFQQTCLELTADLTKEVECPTETCTPEDPYRTISGCCNNIGQRFRGSAARAFARLLPADYSNKVDLPRGGMDPSVLPSPRNISTTVHGVPVTGQLPPISLMVFQFGQFLDHDLTLTPEDELECCNPEVLEMDNKKDQSLRRCFNINATNDLFYSGKTDCLPLTRSDATCTKEIREQFNANTAFIDASMVYGSDTDTSNKLRGTNGELKTHEGPILQTLPSRKQSGFDSSHGEHPEDLVSGDIRTIEQPALASMHSLFLSEHNNIVRLLKENNDKLDDEELYQTARQVVGAEIQNIVFSEFLPVVLGKDIMTKFNLNLPEDKKGDTKYDPAVDPTIDNVFATVAFRFGHSLIPNMFLPSTNPIRSSNRCPLKENFFKFEEFVIGDDASGKAWQNMLKGIIKQPSPAMDAFVVSNARDFLFCHDCSIPGGFGQDLIARNIQRGRDHGIPPYVKFREYCNLPVPASWSSPLSEISPENWENLQKVYANVEDIDAFTGGLSEEAVNGSLVGPTIACLIATQFNKILSGDRYFFTHSLTPSSEKGLPPSVKAAIRNRNLGDILCTNTDAVSTAASVMKISNSQNETPCSDRDGLGKIIEELSPRFCSDGWARFGSSCYRLWKEELDWDSAELRCRQYGGHLSSMLSEEERKFIHDNFYKNNKHSTWIGASDKTIEGVWTWSDGSAMKFDNWGVGQPDNYGSGQDCVTWRESLDGKWDDGVCSSRYNFLCKTTTTTGFFWNTAMVIKGSRNQIALLPYIAKVYSVSFDVLINNLGTSKWQSIIHFTQSGADNSVYGDRTPAVWLKDGRGFHICSAINGNKDKCYTDPIHRQVGVWYHVEISQYLTGNKLRYDIKINQETVFNIENTQAEEFEKVQVFSGDQGSPLDGLISNIAVKT